MRLPLYVTVHRYNRDRMMRSDRLKDKCMMKKIPFPFFKNIVKTAQGYKVLKRNYVAISQKSRICVEKRFYLGAIQKVCHPPTTDF